MGSRLSRLCPYSPKSSIPSGRGWASASPEAGSAGSLSHQARIVVAVLRPLPSARPGPATRPEAINISAGGKARTGRDRKATPLQADGSGPCRSAASRAGVPHFCDSSCSLGSTAKRLGRSEAGSQTFRQGQTASIRNAGGQAGPSPAGRQVPSSKAQLSSGALGHQNRFELGQPIATNVHQLWPGLSHADTLWV